MTFIDDCTKLQAVMYLRRKSDAFEAFKTFKAYAENQLNAKIKAVQDDKAGEYMSAAFHKFMDQCGIARRHSTRNRPQQNGVAGRANRTISDHVTAMLNEAKLPASFWALAVTAYVHVWNRLPTAPLPGTTPYTQWFKRKPDISHFRVFGCTAYVYIQRDKRKSLQPHMEKCIFVGYPSGYKGWNVPNVVPDAPNAPQQLQPVPPPPAPVPAPARAPRAPRPPKGTIQRTRRSDRAPKPPTAWWIVPPAPGGPAPSQAASASVADDEESQPSLDDDMEEVQSAGAVSTSDPYNYRQAIQADDSERWKEATLAEYNTLLQNGTWEIVDLPPGEKAIGSSWVFRI